MKRLIATIILAIIAIVIAGCDVTYHHVRHHHAPGPRAIIVTRAPHHEPHGHHGPHGHHPHKHWRIH